MFLDSTIFLYAVFDRLDVNREHRQLAFGLEIPPPNGVSPPMAAREAAASNTAAFIPMIDRLDKHLSSAQ